MSDLVSWAQIMSQALVTTMALGVVVSFLTIGLSVLLALSLVSPWHLLRIAVRVYVDVFRSIPLLALMIFIYFGAGPAAAQHNVSGFWLAAAALTINNVAYLTETYRAALHSVAQSQWDAGASLGLGWPGVVFRIVAPQAVLPSIPGSVNMLILVLKGTAIASLIGVYEVTAAANSLVSQTFRPMEILLLLATMYLALILPLTFLAGRLEARVRAVYGIQAERLSTQRGPRVWPAPEV